MKKYILVLAAVLGLAASSARAEVLWPIASSVYHRSYNNTYLDTQANLYFGVWPVAWGHTAGAVFTVDGWATAKWSNAGWLANVNNSFGGQDENWNLTMTGRNNSAGYAPITFEYALYVKTQAGQWFWANNGGNNYRITHYAYYR